jgi:hypothetical protein
MRFTVSICTCLTLALVCFSYWLLLSSFDIPQSEFPHPDLEWEHFFATVSQLNESNQRVWDPLKNSLQPWIKTRYLKSEYGDSVDHCCTIS